MGWLQIDEPSTAYHYKPCFYFYPALQWLVMSLLEMRLLWIHAVKYWMTAILYTKQFISKAFDERLL